MLDHLALLEDEVLAMTAAIKAADPDQDIAACPGWTTRDLVTHLVAVHRWATAAIGSDGPPEFTERTLTDLAADYADASAHLLARLREVGADGAAWTFWRAERTAGFWRRRQLHEVAVHRWDLTGDELSDVVARDGIDEVVELLAPRQIALGRIPPLSGGLRMAAPDQTWCLGTPPWTELSGRPAELLLRLWGRGRPLPPGWTGLTP